MLLERHLSVSVIIFCLCLYNYYFPKVPIKAFFFPSTRDMTSWSFNRFSQRELLVRTQILPPICASVFPTNYSLVVSRACTEIIWCPKGTNKSINYECNLGGLAMSQWWVELCSLDLFRPLNFPDCTWWQRCLTWRRYLGSRLGCKTAVWNHGVIKEACCVFCADGGGTHILNEIKSTIRPHRSQKLESFVECATKKNKSTQYEKIQKSSLSY